MKKLSIIFAFFTLISVRAQMPNTISAAEKVYGLSTFWQEVNYNFVYLDKVDRAKWDAAYKEMIVSVQQTKDDYEYYRQMQKFCALLKDGHTNVDFPEAVSGKLFNTMFGKYRLFIQNIEDKPIIIHVNPTKKEEIPVGSEIVSVNGKPAIQYLKEDVEPYISSSTDYVLRDWAVSQMLKGRDGQSYTLGIKKPDGKTITVQVTHAKSEEEALFPAMKPWPELLDFKWYPNNVAYVALNSFGDAKIDSLFVAKLPELYKAKALVIDLRNNGGGSTNVGTEILQYLTNDTILYGSKNRSRLHIPSFKAWGKFATANDTINNEWQKKAFLSAQDKFYYDFEYEPLKLQSGQRKIVVPTVILMGHQTASAAEDFLIYADNQKHMIKIGENSFGSTGQPLLFDMPGGGSARVCTKQDRYPDGREFVGYGIKPDIVVRKTVKDFMKDTDPVLEKALTYLKSKIK